MLSKVIAKISNHTIGYASMKKSAAFYSSISLLAASLSTFSYAAQEFDPDIVLKQKKSRDEKVFLEYLNYIQSLYSSGMDVELGEKARFEAAFRYLPTKSTFFRFRLLVDPKRSKYENKTSEIEVLINHTYEAWELQADFALNFDDHSRGATSLGPDVDSEYSYIAYNLNPNLKLSFYPYNFDGEVGRVFKTDDVTRIYYIEGTPDFISNLPLDGEKIRAKTLPGFELSWAPSTELTTYVGVGAGRYIYPNQDNFSIEENVSSERWKTKTDVGYKAGIKYNSEHSSARLEYVTHTQATEGGALLDTAASLQLNQKLSSSLSLYLESSYSSAAGNAYNIDRSSSWFAQTTPFRPVYSDFYGQKQDWLGKKDFAHYLKISYENGSNKPYASYKRVGANFVYREDESAHRLRTADQSQSHGGLDIYGLGVDLGAGDFTITPEVEYKKAANRVFGNKNDLREDKELIELNRDEISVKLYATYEL